MTTMLSIVQDALRDVGSFEIPAEVAGNSNETAELALSLLNRLGRRLSLLHDWQDLQVEYTFATVASTASYSLPSDFRKFALLTQWDRTNYRRMQGPTTPATWQYIKSSSLVTETIDRYFRLFSGNFHIYPTPTAVETIGYEYYSKNWCTDSGGTGKAAFTLDDDLAVLDDELLITGLKAAFLQEKGEPFEMAMAAHVQYRDALLGIDNGPRMIRFGQHPRDDMNLPESGYGT